MNKMQMSYQTKHHHNYKNWFKVRMYKYKVEQLETFTLARMTVGQVYGCYFLHHCVCCWCHYLLLCYLTSEMVSFQGLQAHLEVVELVHWMGLRWHNLVNLCWTVSCKTVKRRQRSHNQLLTSHYVHSLKIIITLTASPLFIRLGWLYLQSAPGTNQYKAMKIMFLAQENNKRQLKRFEITPEKRSYNCKSGCANHSLQ